MALFISEKDVDSLVTISDAITAIAEVFRLSGATSSIATRKDLNKVIDFLFGRPETRPALASKVYELAIRHGVGLEVPLTDG